MCHKRRANCLGVRGFVKTSIGKPLSFDALGNRLCAFGVADLECRAVVIAEGEFGKVAMQVGLAAVLIDALHAALEHGPDVLDRVGMDRAANVFILGITGLR